MYAVGKVPHSCIPACLTAASRDLSASMSPSGFCCVLCYTQMVGKDTPGLATTALIRVSSRQTTRSAKQSASRQVSSQPWTQQFTHARLHPHAAPGHTRAARGNCTQHHSAVDYQRSTTRHIPTTAEKNTGTDPVTLCPPCPQHHSTRTPCTAPHNTQTLTPHRGSTPTHACIPLSQAPESVPQGPRRAAARPA